MGASSTRDSPIPNCPLNTAPRQLSPQHPDTTRTPARPSSHPCSPQVSKGGRPGVGQPPPCFSLTPCIPRALLRGRPQIGLCSACPLSPSTPRPPPRLAVHPPQGLGTDLPSAHEVRDLPANLTQVPVQPSLPGHPTSLASLLALTRHTTPTGLPTVSAPSPNWNMNALRRGFCLCCSPCTSASRPGQGRKREGKRGRERAWSPGCRQAGCLGNNAQDSKRLSSLGTSQPRRWGLAGGGTGPSPAAKNGGAHPDPKGSTPSLRSL